MNILKKIFVFSLVIMVLGNFKKSIAQNCDQNLTFNSIIRGNAVFEARNISTNSPIAENSTISFLSNESVKIKTGFKVSSKNNASVFIKVEDNLCNNLKSTLISQNTTNKEKTSNVTESTYDIISLYPNPSSGLVNIKGLGDNLFTVSIINALGNEVLVGSNNSKLDLTSYSEGIYIIKIKTNSGLYTTERIVIQKK